MTTMMRNALLGLVLLAALLVALWAKRMRRGLAAKSAVPVTSMQTQREKQEIGKIEMPVTEQLPPVFVNEYSPVLVQGASQLLSELPWLRLDEREAGSEAERKYSEPLTPLPLPHVPMRKLPVQLNSEVVRRPRRVLLRTSGVESKSGGGSTLETRPPEGQEQEQRQMPFVPTTEGLPFLSRVALPHRPPSDHPLRWSASASVGAQGGGLLRRYANRQE